MYAVVSRNQQKRVELTIQPEQIRLSLKQAGEASPYFTANLQDMLSYSTGRPWRLERRRLEEVRVTSQEDSLLLTGKLAELTFRLQLSFDEHHVLRVKAAWDNRTARLVTDAAVGIVFPLQHGSKETVTIPHMIYNNNPSSDPDRIVPRLGAGPGRGFICEEHRLPIPGVNVEWTGDGQETRYLSLFAVPSFVELADGTVQYGSLGAVESDDVDPELVLAAMSGVLMFNGEHDVYCIAKNITERCDKGYLDFPPGFSLSKELALDWGHAEGRGRGFREIVRTGHKLFEPEGAKPLSLEELIRLKSAAMDDRWRTNAQGAAGYIKFSDSNVFGNVSKHPLHYMYGWTGQCLRLAWCDAELGFRLQQEQRIKRCEQAIEFYLQGSRTAVPGIRYSSYRLEDGSWEHFRRGGLPVISSRALGETMSDVADIVMLFQANGKAVPSHWIEALCEAVEFFAGSVLPSGIITVAWQPDGGPVDELITAAGLPCLIALAKSYRITGNERYLHAAEAMMRCYYELHAETFARPFARSTLDAKCEDKEAGMYFFLAAYELLNLTRKPCYREWAELAADWLLTFVYVWNPVYDQGSAFRTANFKAAGWPGVSVQNHHLDVFFPSFAFWQFGRLTGSALYERMGRMALDAMGQGICTQPGEWGFTVTGEQGEGFFQTNWNHRGHGNKWNPSWVIALVLSNALQFQQAIPFENNRMNEERRIST
ncbi:hypothetical protein [Paenibacillus sp. y28]|uniref:hypothetical protein n=1 Tax=Paenibacillus sp. y28 TaxID=3129110 RepID=UPI003018DC2E